MIPVDDLSIDEAGEILAKVKAGQWGQTVLKWISVIKKELAKDRHCKADSEKQLS
jgi:hypothetical protein